MLEDLKKDATQRMQKCVSAFRDQLKKMRTGRAHTSLIEHIKVYYYGSEMPLNQVANIATEDARTLTVSPWEKAMVPIIEKAIYKSDLGLTPNSAGTLIRINMPALTEERRRDITKVVRSEAEGARFGAQRAPRSDDRIEGNAQGKTHRAGRRPARPRGRPKAYRQARGGNRS